MRHNKKVTVVLPDRLLTRAQKATGEGVTPTIRRGLELIAAEPAFAALRKLRGKVHFSSTLERLRDDSR